jgi:hypothetical protein
VEQLAASVQALKRVLPADDPLVESAERRLADARAERDAARPPRAVGPSVHDAEALLARREAAVSAMRKQCEDAERKVVASKAALAESIARRDDAAASLEQARAKSARPEARVGAIAQSIVAALRRATKQEGEAAAANGTGATELTPDATAEFVRQVGREMQSFVGKLAEERAALLARGEGDQGPQLGGNDAGLAPPMQHGIASCSALPRAGGVGDDGDAELPAADNDDEWDAFLTAQLDVKRKRLETLRAEKRARSSAG